VTRADAQPYRLAAGGLIERTRPLAFTFDGQPFTGHAGDTLASALLANGVHLVGRSFKLHRPRGVFSAGPEEPNALVELRTGARREPNTRATTVELFDGLAAASQNRWPSLRFDALAVTGLFSPLLAAGFYYKTFMWPAAFWERVYETLIRRATGLGHAAEAPDPDAYEKAHLHCDVLVIGAGAAGLMAARAASRAGARTVLLEEDWRLGGRALAEAMEIDGAPAAQWVESIEAELAGTPNCRILRRTAAYGLFDHFVVGAVERVADHLPEPPAHLPRQRAWRIVARRIVVAAGAIERPIVFAGNDRPGVMLAGAVRAYVHRYAVRPGRRAVVFTAGDDGWRTLPALASAGVEVAAVVDPRAEIAPALRALAERAGARIVAGKVAGTIGRRRLAAVDWRDARGEVTRLQADLLAVSGGWNPSVHLACHLGARPRWDDTARGFLLDTPPEGVTLAGAAAGRVTLAAALADGLAAGDAAARDCGFTPAPALAPRAEDEPRDGIALFHVPARSKAFVDLQNDVTADDVALAHREGYRSVEHLKRYTTLGMATDQGKTSSVPGIAIMAELTGGGIAGTTTFRPPWTPVAIGALAGPHRGREFRPTRRTPTHAWAEAHGATFVEVGPWLRAQWYMRAGETRWQDSVAREVRAVRAAVGVCDVSTLGKIEVVGPDAAAFLDVVYTNTISTLRVGRVRYGLMLREDGFVLDDGTVARLAEDRFFLTTTTANAGRVMQHLEHAHQVLRPELDLAMLSVTDAWAQVSIAGPRSRDLLAALLDPGTDVSDAALPHMAVTAARVGGVAVRLYRLSFSGERAYEIGIPPDYGTALIERIMQAGAPFGVTPYGTEALGVLRIEKGHPAGGELNGHTTAADLGLARLVSARKDCIGARMAQRPALADSDRPALVGLKPRDRRSEIRAGAHLLAPGAAETTDNGEGYVTSACFSPTLGHPIALALLRRGPARIGETVRVYDALRGGDTLAEVCAPVFVDPEGARTRG
jgi:heterotetrameric sarcosine oxidase alpha subunit